uniref:Uncharacterized protein n=1 Tax=Quercus lobata TaxID=97700 RepID=A0A7N2LNW7_QUELO
MDKNHTAPNFGLVNKADLNRILRSEIFLHLDEQLCAADVILGHSSSGIACSTHSQGGSNLFEFNSRRRSGQSDRSEKKRKRDRKRKEVTKEGEVVPSKDLEPQKRAKPTKVALRKNMAEGSSMKVVSKRHPKVSIWNPSLELDGALLLLDSSIRDFQKGNAGYVDKALEQPLLLP